MFSNHEEAFNVAYKARKAQNARDYRKRAKFTLCAVRRSVFVTAAGPFLALAASF